MPSVNARYWRNRTPHTEPTAHQCICCKANVYCDKQPCYVPPRAPFYLCPACIQRTADALSYRTQRERRGE